MNGFARDLITGLDETVRLPSSPPRRSHPALLQAHSPSGKYSRIKQDLLVKRQLFVDSSFPATSSSLYLHPARTNSIEWKRPYEIRLTPRFIYANATRFDLDQGELGNCWFVAAAATLAISNRGLFNRVVPADQSFNLSDYAGIFHFKFWRFGQWLEVIVDDRLPVRRNANGYRLVYAQNIEEPDEFWAALLEKAYAKLHGSYEAIDGGHIQNALVDMTGGISEEIDMKDKTNIPKDLFSIMTKTSSMHSMMGVAIPTARLDREQKLTNGIYRGHAYSITGVLSLSINSRPVNLVRLRNPWGRSEWTGAYSDNSLEMVLLMPEQRRQMQIVIKNDGEFWMTFQDMVSIFSQLSFCHLVPDALTVDGAQDVLKKAWDAKSVHGEWLKGVSAGGCGNPPYQENYWTNPQIIVGLDAPGPANVASALLVSLMEKENPYRTQPAAVGFDIWKLKDGVTSHRIERGNLTMRELTLVKRADMYSHNREITLRLLLTNGSYVIIPALFEVNQEAKFLLRIFTEMTANTSEIVAPRLPLKPMIATARPINTLDNLFRLYAGQDVKIDAFELKDLLNDYFKVDLRELDGDRFGMDSSRSLLAMMDRDESGLLSLAEVKSMMAEIQVWKSIFAKHDMNNSGYINVSELQGAFLSIGFSVGKKVLRSVARRYGGKRGRISFTDFLICMSKLTVMYGVFQRYKPMTSSKAELMLDDWLAAVLLY